MTYLDPIEGSQTTALFVFLDKGEKNLYQLRQWVQPLERLAKRVSVAVIYSSEAVGRELASTSLLGYRFQGSNDLMSQLELISPRVMLYPNQNIRNFYALRYMKAAHVFLSHGESDKAYMAQNTLKRYDYYFASGPAARHRVESNIANFAQDRILEIGRPQSLDEHTMPVDLAKSESLRVLYAPTWEGVTLATKYSSIDSHGIEIVEKLISEPGIQLTYRPHPLSGSRDSTIAIANKKIIRLIQKANQSRDSDKHYVDRSDFGWHLGYHDVLVSDISAVAYDWLSTGKSLVMTKPKEKRAVITDFPILKKLPTVSYDNTDRILEIIRESQSEENSNEVLRLQSTYFRHPVRDSDEYFVQGIQHVLKEVSTHLCDSRAVSNLFNPRGEKLGFLKYPNFIIRESYRMVGIWSLAKYLKKEEISEVFVYFSDPFDDKSISTVLPRLIDEVGENSTIVLLTNQVTNFLRVRSLEKTIQVKSKFINLKILPVVTAGDCELVLRNLNFAKANYLKHHPLNHMLLRLNQVEHVLWKPGTDPNYSPDHTLIVYDSILDPDPSSASVISEVLPLSRPRLASNSL